MNQTDAGHFESVDWNGNPFWAEWDGAEGIGFWVGDPEDSIPLSIEVSQDFIEWILSNWKKAEDIESIAAEDDSGQ